VMSHSRLSDLLLCCETLTTLPFDPVSTRRITLNAEGDDYLTVTKHQGHTRWQEYHLQGQILLKSLLYC